MISFQDEVGTTMDDLAPISGDQSPCSFCGVFRRRCMNQTAKELGADVLATGHNLDDTAQSVLMNFMRGDVEAGPARTALGSSRAWSRASSRCG